jgi:ABC-type xylose transport system permease subunit
MLMETELICWSSKHKFDFTFEKAVFEGSNLNPILMANSSSSVTATISVMIICFFCIDEDASAGSFFGAFGRLSKVSCLNGLRLFGVFFALSIVVASSRFGGL